MAQAIFDQAQVHLDTAFLSELHHDTVSMWIWFGNPTLIQRIADYLGPVSVDGRCALTRSVWNDFNENQYWRSWFLNEFGYHTYQWLKLLSPKTYRSLCRFFCHSTVVLRPIPQLDTQQLFFLTQVRSGEEILVPLHAAPHGVIRSYNAARTSFHVQNESLRDTFVQFYNHGPPQDHRDRWSTFGDTLEVLWYACQPGRIAKVASFTRDSEPTVSTEGTTDYIEFDYDDEAGVCPGVPAAYAEEPTNCISARVTLTCPTNHPQKMLIEVLLEFPNIVYYMSEDEIYQYLKGLPWAVL